jgi:CHASE2 domain-containing sensor protein
LLIWLCSLIISLLAYMISKNKTLLIMIVLELGLFLISYGLLLIYGFWLPSIPSGLVIILTPISMWIGEIDFKKLEERFEQKLIDEV